MLLDKDNPGRIITGTRHPVLSPEEEYEVHGFFSNVVFPCGILKKETGIQVFYGAADDKICSASLSWDVIWEVLDV